MSIQEILEKFKASRHSTDFFLAIILVLVGLTSFCLGRLSIEERITDTDQNASIVQIDGNEHPTQDTKGVPGAYVASKSGSKYHLPWCTGAQQISEKNKIWFSSKAEAEAAGYTPAANCKGI